MGISSVNSSEELDHTTNIGYPQSQATDNTRLQPRTEIKDNMSALTDT